MIGHFLASHPPQSYCLLATTFHCVILRWLAHCEGDCRSWDIISDQRFLEVFKFICRHI